MNHRRCESPRGAVLLLLAAAAVLAPSLSGCLGGDSSTDPPEDLTCPVDGSTAFPAPFAEKSGVVVYTGCSEVASWNHEEDGESYGEVLVSIGDTSPTYEVRFIDHDLPREHITNRPGTVQLDATCFELVLATADSSVAIAEAIPSVPWGFRVHGLAAGYTTLTVSVLRDGILAVSSGPVGITVEDPAVTPELQDFTIVLNGIRYVFVVEGSLVASCGSTTADPGYLPAKVGEITNGHYSFRSLDPGDACRARTYDESVYHLAFEFQDPCLCGVINHPEHFGVNTTFHLSGLAAGTTAVRFRLLEGTEVQYVTPWVPVIVEP